MKENQTLPFGMISFLKLIFSTFLLASLMSSLANSQALTSAPPLPMEDAAGVQLTTGYPSVRQTDLVIGNGVSSLSHTIAAHENMFWGFLDDYRLHAMISVVPLQGYRIVSIGHQTHQFSLVSGDVVNSGVYKATNQDGGKLVQLTSTTFQHTSRDGIVSIMGTPVETITHPNGLVISIYKKLNRIQSVVTNTGLQLKYNYRSNTYPANPITNDAMALWRDPSSIVAINNAVEYCDPNADSCTLTNSWPTVKYEWPTWAQLYPAEGAGTAIGFFKVKDAMNRTTIYQHNSYTKSLYGGYPYEPRITTITGPGGSQNFDYRNLSVCEQAYGITLEEMCRIVKRNVVITSTALGVNCTYSYALPQTNYVGMQITSRCGNQFASVVSDHYGTIGGPMTVTGPDLIAHFMQSDRRLLNNYIDKGKIVSFRYDARGNQILRTQSAASGSAEEGTQIISDAGFDECDQINFRWCNKPRWTRSPEGYTNNFRTDYSYYDAHGGIKSIELPPDKNGFRAKTQYFYEQRYAWYKNASGSYTQATTPVWLLTEERTCTQGDTVGTTCSNPTKLVIKNYEYGAASGPNNLWLKGESVTANGEVRRTCYQYNWLGQQISVIEPNANLSSCQ